MKLRFFTILFTSLVLSLLGSTSVFAAAYVVDNLGDESDGECVVDTSFKEAVNCSNASGEADTITFGVSGTITLDGAPQLDGDGVDIDGNGDITLDGNGGGGIGCFFSCTD